MPLATSTASIRSPSLGLPLHPYHSPTRKTSPRTVEIVRPSARSRSEPSLSAYQPTENGAELPQSKARSILHEEGIANFGTLLCLWLQTSSNIPPAITFQSPLSHAAAIALLVAAASTVLRYSGSASFRCRFSRRCPWMAARGGSTLPSLSLPSLITCVFHHSPSRPNRALTQFVPLPYGFVAERILRGTPGVLERLQENIRW